MQFMGQTLVFLPCSRLSINLNDRVVKGTRIDFSRSSKKVLEGIILHPGKQGSARVDCSSTTNWDCLITSSFVFQCHSQGCSGVGHPREHQPQLSISLGFYRMSWSIDSSCRTRPMIIKELPLMVIYSHYDVELKEGPILEWFVCPPDSLVVWLCFA